jgi:hypothetical protein
LLSIFMLLALVIIVVWLQAYVVPGLFPRTSSPPCNHEGARQLSVVFLIAIGTARYEA